MPKAWINGTGGRVCNVTLPGQNVASLRCIMKKPDFIDCHKMRSDR